MFKFFRKKEEKRRDLEKELQEFKQEYNKYFNCYAFDGENIIIYKEPYILKDDIVMSFLTENTPKDHHTYAELWVLQLKYGKNFLKDHRINFLRIKRQLEKFGFKFEKLNYNHDN